MSALADITGDETEDDIVDVEGEVGVDEGFLSMLRGGSGCCTKGGRCLWGELDNANTCGA